jgi:hypothetical protein
VQAIVDSTLAELKGLDGVKSVQRVVCGGCLDYKVVVGRTCVESASRLRVEAGRKC